MEEHWFPRVARSRVPAIDTNQMMEVDRLMERELAIGLVRMMELAGRHLAHLARLRFLDGDPTGRRVLVLAGGGGNGGGALVAARRLSAWGARVTLFLAQRPGAMRGVPAEQLAIARQMGIPGVDEPGRADDLIDARRAADVVIDGLIGYGLREPPRGLAAALIDAVGSSASRVLSLDLPSGLHASTGDLLEPVVRAEATMTLALPKTGLYAAVARACVGDLYLADIGVPPTLFERPTLGLAVPALFSRSDILRVDD